MQKNFKLDYNPIYFMASLGNGGLVVSVFMYLMFLIKHPDAPIPTYDHAYAALIGTNQSLAVMTAFVLVAMLYFSFQHLRTLFLNQVAFNRFKKTAAYDALKQSNNEVSLMAIPLTYAMSMNVIFMVAVIFIPGLWSVIEYIFPFALLGFIAIAAYALKLFLAYITRIMQNGGFDFDSNNSFSQLLSSFAFIMIAVGFSSPAAMSSNPAVYVIGLVGAIFFSVLSLILLSLYLVLGFRSILKNGIAIENTPTIWMILPIMTVLGITIVRVASGISHHLLHVELNPVVLFVILAVLVSIQAISGLVGFALLKKTNYFADFVHGAKSSAGSYSLICPGVGTVVLGMFFIHWGFVKTQIISQFSPLYFALLLPLLFIQIKTILVLIRLNKKHLCQGGNCEVNTETTVQA